MYFGQPVCLRRKWNAPVFGKLSGLWRWHNCTFVCVSECCETNETSIKVCQTSTIVFLASINGGIYLKQIRILMYTVLQPTELAIESFSKLENYELHTALSGLYRFNWNYPHHADDWMFAAWNRRGSFALLTYFSCRKRKSCESHATFPAGHIDQHRPFYQVKDLKKGNKVCRGNKADWHSDIWRSDTHVSSYIWHSVLAKSCGLFRSIDAIACWVHVMAWHQVLFTAKPPN